MYVLLTIVTERANGLRTRGYKQQTRTYKLRGTDQGIARDTSAAAYMSPFSVESLERASPPPSLIKSCPVSLRISQSSARWLSAQGVNHAPPTIMNVRTFMSSCAFWMAISWRTAFIMASFRATMSKKWAVSIPVAVNQSGADLAGEQPRSRRIKSWTS